jgi:hypothetical protein
MNITSQSDSVSADYILGSITLLIGNMLIW